MAWMQTDLWSGGSLVVWPVPGRWIHLRLVVPGSAKGPEPRRSVWSLKDSLVDWSLEWANTCYPPLIRYLGWGERDIQSVFRVELYRLNSHTHNYRANWNACHVLWVYIYQPTDPTKPSSSKQSLSTPLMTLFLHLVPLALLIVFYLISFCVHCFCYVLVNFSCLRVAVCLSMFLLIQTYIYIIYIKIMGHGGVVVCRDVHPPLRPWCIFPLFQISPLFSKKFSDSVENFKNFTFSRKSSRFSSAKISDDFFLFIDHKFHISPLFSLFQYISPLFRENYSFPLISQISPLF